MVYQPLVKAKNNAYISIRAIAGYLNKYQIEIKMFGSIKRTKYTFKNGYYK